MNDHVESPLDDVGVDELEGFAAYQQYVALKIHFNGVYNWKKYKGKIPTVTKESFQKRRDKKFFQIIESRYSSAERNQIFVANFVYNRHLWIGELLAENCVGIWSEWRGRISRLYYQFEEDLKNSLEEIRMRKSLTGKEALKFLIHKPDNTHPLILRFVWGGMFEIESYMLVSKLLNLRNVYHPFFKDDKLWLDFEQKMKKYEHFLGPNLNQETIKSILLKVIKE